MNLLTPEQIENFPVAHFSPSSIRKFLENPHGFFKNYVRYEFDESISPALAEGNVLHSVLAEYFTAVMEKKGKKFDRSEAIERLFQEKFNAEEIKKMDWGKTGSLEKSRSTIENAIDSYFSEIPEIEHIVSVEERFLTEFEDLNNVTMPIALKGFTDIITLVGDEYVIRDHKFVSNFSDPTDLAEIAKYEMQAAPYFFLARKRYGKNPARMIFDEVKKSKNRDGSPQRREVKKSKNRDGSPQRREVVIEYTPQLLNRWLEIYKRVVKTLAGIPLIDPETGVMQFLPNPFAQFGDEAWFDFCEEVDQGKVWTFDEIKNIRASKYSRAEEMEALF